MYLLGVASGSRVAAGNEFADQRPCWTFGVERSSELGSLVLLVVHMAIQVPVERTAVGCQIDCVAVGLEDCGTERQVSPYMAAQE